MRYCQIQYRSPQGAEKCRVHDMGSLDPLDIGFDLRATSTPVSLPNTLAASVVLPRSKRHPQGQRVTGTISHVADRLRSAGFVVRGGE